MRIFLILFTIIFIVPAQEDAVKVYWVEKGEIVQVFVNNRNIYPITIEFNSELTNLEPAKKLPVVEVIPAGEEKHLVDLKIKNRTRSWDYTATYKYYIGDIEARHNDHFAYRLPYRIGSEYKLTQGFNGSFSHTGDLRHALDFHMETGSQVYAARGGVVVDLEESHDKGGPLELYMPYTNFVTVMHDDGTFADYSHLKKDGAAVEVGQKVRMGQLIGYSGATGFASGPHLHFVVKKAKKGGGYISIPVKFVTREGIIELQEGKVYAGY